VTNQAGIGRGYYSEQDFLELTEWMCGLLRERGAPIDKVYFCPFHPEYGVGSYKAESDHRKPAPGMILQAAQEFDIELKSSVLVGDKATDIQAGIAAGVGCNLLYVGGLRAEPSSTGATATVSTLVDAIPYLRRQALANQHDSR